MKKMNEKAREHDYYISGYAMNSYHPQNSTIDICEALKSILFVALCFGALAVFLISLFGVGWIEFWGHDTFFGFSMYQLAIGGGVSFALFSAISQADM